MLKGENIYLRAMEPEDAEVLFRWENNPEIWRVSETMAPYSRHHLEQFAASVQDLFLARQLRLIICANEGTEPVGAIDLFEFEPMHQRAGIGILIAEKEHRNAGFASEALKVLIEYAFSVLPLRLLYCNIHTDNEVSIKLFKKFGFEIVGTRKQWSRKGPDEYSDEHLLQLLRPSH